MRTTYQHLQPEERMTLASLRAQGFSLRTIAQQMRRSASTLSRELARNGPLKATALKLLSAVTSSANGPIDQSQSFMPMACFGIW